MRAALKKDHMGSLAVRDPQRKNKEMEEKKRVSYLKPKPRLSPLSEVGEDLRTLAALLLVVAVVGGLLLYFVLTISDAG